MKTAQTMIIMTLDEFIDSTSVTIIQGLRSIVRTPSGCVMCLLIRLTDAILRYNQTLTSVMQITGRGASSCAAVQLNKVNMDQKSNRMFLPIHGVFKQNWGGRYPGGRFDTLRLSVKSV